MDELLMRNPKANQLSCLCDSISALIMHSWRDLAEHLHVNGPSC